MGDAWFVDEGVNILRGEAAERAVRERSDAKFLKEGEGVVSVPRERWQVAQTFERTGWVEKWRSASDDRNIEHAQEFCGYKTIEGRRFGQAIELGCGPFTNARVIGEIAQIDAVTLLDPLLDSYLTLPSCRYSAAGLRAHFGKKVIPVRELLNIPIEEMGTEGRRYDLVMMMNVIEHCFDVHAIFAKILAITGPGSVLAFHDYVYDAEKAKRVLADKYYEAGHPLMVAGPVIEKFLWDNFTPLYYSRRKCPADQIEVQPRSGKVYFIGERK